MSVNYTDCLPAQLNEANRRPGGCWSSSCDREADTGGALGSGVVLNVGTGKFRGILTF